MRIGAILSVKDEVELIEPAILHLRAIGVDRFVRRNHPAQCIVASGRPVAA